MKKKGGGGVTMLALEMTGFTSFMPNHARYLISLLHFAQLEALLKQYLTKSL